MKPPPTLTIDDSIVRLIKASVGGANDTIVNLNSTLEALQKTIAGQQTILADANSTIARLSAENAELRSASLERDRVVRVLDLELEKVRLFDKRKGELLDLAKTLGAGALGYMHAARALPPAPVNASLSGLSIKDLGLRLLGSLKPETVAAIRADAGDPLFEALIRACMAEEPQPAPAEVVSVQEGQVSS